MNFEDRFGHLRTTEALKAAIARREAGDEKAGKIEGTIVALITLQRAIASLVGPRIISPDGMLVRMAFATLVQMILRDFSEEEKNYATNLMENYLRDIADIQKGEK